MECELQIRECSSIEDLTECVQIQREVFALPEAELSPVRHLIVTINAGGFVIGAFEGERLAGFVLSVPAFLLGERAFYSHMAGVRHEYQTSGVGANLKWAQRTRALAQGVKYIKWTFDPVKARNAYFNLEKLGAIVREYKPNFYGADYAAAGSDIGMPSDRLFAEWKLESPKVLALASGDQISEHRDPDAAIFVRHDWPELLARDPAKAVEEQRRIRGEFEAWFARGLVGRGFTRMHRDVLPSYLLYRD